MRRTIWLGSGIAALMIAVAATAVWQGGMLSPRPAPAPAAAVAVSPPAPARQKQPAAPARPPSFDVVTVDPSGEAVIAGRAMPGDKVRVLDGGRPIGEVTADARGEWVLVPKAPIAPGNRQLSLDATGPNGGPVRRSDEVVALSVVRPGTAGGKQSAIAVLLPGNVSQPARVLQEPSWASSVRKLLSLDTATLGPEHRLVLSGHGVPSARVRIFAGNLLLGTATADAAGQWSLASAQTLPPGGFELWLEQLGADGSVVSRVGAPFEPPAAGALGAGGSYIVQSGNSLWVIARRLYGSGTTYTAIYAANRGQIRDPDLIYPGQSLKVPVSK